MKAGERQDILAIFINRKLSIWSNLRKEKMSFLVKFDCILILLIAMSNNRKAWTQDILEERAQRPRSRDRRGRDQGGVREKWKNYSDRVKEGES